MKIVGYRRTSFTPKDGGTQISGFNLYVSFQDPNVIGEATDRIFVSDARLNGFVPSVGVEVQIFYNKYGRVSAIAEVL